MRIAFNRCAPAEWEALADSAAALLQQRWAYGTAAEQHSRTVARATLFDGNRPIGLAQILHRKILWSGFSLCLAGPVWLGNADLNQRRAALKQLTRYYPEKGPLVVMPSSADEAEGMGLLPVVSPSSLALLPLSPDTGQMRAQLRVKWRNRLVRAEAASLKIKEERATPDRIAHILALEAKQRAAHNYRGIPLSYLRTLSEQIKTETRLFSAYADRKLCAQMLHLIHGTSATYLVGWTDSMGRGVGAHNLLLWRAMSSLADRGVIQLDLGTINTVEAPGLARFKLGTGAKVHRLGGAWARALPRFGMGLRQPLAGEALEPVNRRVNLTDVQNAPKGG